MGADLLLTYLPIETGNEPNFEAGKTYIQGLDVDVLVKAADEAYGDLAEVEAIADLNLGYDLHDEDTNLLPAVEAALRSHWIDKVDELQETLENWTGRFAVLWQIGGCDVYITGGTSWGDDPGDEYRLIEDLYRVGTLYQEMGFAL